MLVCSPCFWLPIPLSHKQAHVLACLHNAFIFVVSAFCAFGWLPFISAANSSRCCLLWLWALSIRTNQLSDMLCERHFVHFLTKKYRSVWCWIYHCFAVLQTYVSNYKRSLIFLYYVRVLTMLAASIDVFFCFSGSLLRANFNIVFFLLYIVIVRGK